MKMYHFVLTMSMAAVVAALLGTVGCESNTQRTAISVSPSSTTLGGESNLETTVVLTAHAVQVSTNLIVLQYPLTWSVSDDSLGTITASGGNSAIYARTGGSGVNSITVHDQGDAEGVAVVTQY
jgi:hypothetical protein